MELKNINDQILIQKTETYVREERELLTQLLHHFREIERRRLYSDYKYSSLHKMLVGHFGYSDDEAYRRVSAMRLLKDLPEVEAKINKGELSLSHLSLAQSFFRQEQKMIQSEIPKESKLELLEKISEEPIREAQKIVLSQSQAPESLRPDRVNIVSDKKIEFRFVADCVLESKINEVKGLLAHKQPNLTMGDLFELLCDMGLKQLKSNKSPAMHMKRCNKDSVAQLKGQVYREAQFKCTNCKSNYALEVDHYYPKGKGGDNSKENLRLLCRSCNQRSAIKHYGIQKMEHFINT